MSEDLEDSLRIEPLIVRTGARYRCFGDGLCCTDVHALGPLSDEEVVKLKMVRDEVVHYNPLVEANVLTTLANGRCVFLSDQGCALHTPMGGTLKPVGCVRFPLGLTATPDGARVILEHRCPCTLMGERPPLTPKAVRDSLAQDGELTPNHGAALVPIDNETEAPWQDYLALEGPLLEAIATGDLLAALDAPPFPKLEGHDWDALAKGMMTMPVGGRFQAALRWFGEGIKSRGGPIRADLDRPWGDAFDKAEARSNEPSDPDEPFRIFVADAIWSLFWTDHCTLKSVRHELATRLSVGLAIATRLREDGVRADRAAAEAVVVLDLVGTSDWWLAAIQQMP
jgi:hypothetical protein